MGKLESFGAFDKDNTSDPELLQNYISYVGAYVDEVDDLIQSAKDIMGKHFNNDVSMVLMHQALSIMASLSHKEALTDMEDAMIATGDYVRHRTLSN